MQGASLPLAASAARFRRPLPPPATLARLEELNEMRVNEADRGVMVLGANWRLANAKSSMVYGNNPDAACLDEIERTERNTTY